MYLLEPEETWLRKRIIRLRTILRYAQDPSTEAGLKEFIADAEHRLETLQRGMGGQQQQQIQPKKKKLPISTPNRLPGLIG